LYSWTLEESASLLEAMLQGVRMPLVLLDERRGVVRCNRLYLELFDLTAEELARDGIGAIERAANRLLVNLQAPPFWETQIGEEAHDILHFRDGRVFERSVTPCDVGDRVVGRVVTYRDITAAIEAERELEHHRALLEEAQQIAHVGSWVLEFDRNHRVEWSKETQRIFDVTEEQVPKKFEEFRERVHPEDREMVEEAVRQTPTVGSYDLEFRIVRPSGETRWLHARADLGRDATGRLVRLLGTVQDITDRHRLEEQLRQAQKLEAIGRLAGGVAHDMNNALTSIVGYTELALGALASDHPAGADVFEIRRAAERAESVTRQLLAFSRKQPLRPRVFSLGDVTSGIVRMLTRFLGAHVKIDLTIDADVAPMCGDPGQIEQAIVNLAVNARDAMPNGGRLTLAIAMVRIESDVASQHDPIPPGEYVELAIRDTGVGMSPATLAHIFEPFFTTKEPGTGTGLGLATVYGTVKQIGGFVAVESTIGEGTTFRLRFPPALAADLPGTKTASRVVLSSTEPTILVVEDEQSVRNLVLLALSNRGYRVLSAASGSEALTLLDSQSSEIDLPLTDANMPGMSGIELVRQLLVRRPSLAAIVMSGYTEDLPRLGELEDRVALLPKPFTPNEVREQVGRVFGR
jgi:PAS domain S-box-containing protein